MVFSGVVNCKIPSELWRKLFNDEEALFVYFHNK